MDTVLLAEQRRRLAIARAWQCFAAEAGQAICALGEACGRCLVHDAACAAFLQQHENEGEARLRLLTEQPAYPNRSSFVTPSNMRQRHALEKAPSDIGQLPEE
ncbi:hypothetical protein DIPPA_02687 [Diplonema papillatum]|nr:hypothetical protein DIPPA_02687 [Diplonema papillatum]